MKQIDKIHDKLFKSILKNPDNAADLLKTILPVKLTGMIDLSEVVIKPTNYISKKFKEYFSDVTLEIKLKNPGGPKIPAEIYFIFDHKTEGKKTIFIQFMSYMVEAWQEDIKAKRDLRVIIPVVFYHGQKKWAVPRSFLDVFDVARNIKDFMLDYKYILFDTGEWDFASKENADLKKNVFVFTAMALMKYAYSKDEEAMKEIFRFWKESGFVDDIENTIYFLIYISQTQEISLGKLEKMLAESMIPGGDVMQTLAKRLTKEAKQEGIQIGMQKGIQEGMQKGMQKGSLNAKLDFARRMLLDGVPVENVKKYTDLTDEELRTLIN